MTSVALRFRADNFRVQQQGVMGYQSANESLAEALGRYSTSRTLYCHAPTREDADVFERIVTPHRKTTVWVPWDDVDGLRTAGTLFQPAANLYQLVWQRRYHDQRAYSICGLIHTLAGLVMERVTRLITDPFQPWDALICTSNAVRSSLGGIFEQYAEYLGQRLGAKAPALPELPVIPLAIHCDRFAPTTKRKDQARQMRRSMGIPDDAVVVLYFGRMSWQNKSNPYPMFAALQRAATAASVPIHLVMAGFFPTADIAKHYQAAPARLCPAVKVTWLDGGDEQVREHAWHMSDVFVSLADNVQETFGLTPVEAMAAGLPCVVTHWDGYAETVRDGQDGFHIPTALPGTRSGSEIAMRFGAQLLDLPGYLNALGQTTIVDVDATAAAFTTLATQPRLREAMGRSAQQHAKRTFDWSAIIPRYEALWTELAARRASAEEICPRGPGQPADPLYDEPYDIYTPYPSARFDADAVIRATPAAADLAASALRDPILSERLGEMNDPERVGAILDVVANGAPLRAVTEGLDPHLNARTVRLVAWLAKIGAVTIDPLWDPADFAALSPERVAVKPSKPRSFKKRK